MGFVHLHVHSHYTLLRSPITVGKYVSAVKERGMAACALTDRGNLFGAFEFQSAAKDAGIKGILGAQVQVAPLGIREKTRDTSQLVLLVQNPEGYRNLAWLVSKSWLTGFYFEPRVDLDLLREHHEGLLCLTGAGQNGFINRHLAAGAAEEGARQLGLLRDIFTDRLWIEITPHDPSGVDLRGQLARLSAASGVPLCATGWVHYLDKADARIHDIQLAVQDATTLADTRRMRMDAEEYWLRTPAEMAEAFADLPEAVANTEVVAERCAGGGIPTGQYFLPRFPCPDGLDEGGTLRLLARRGAHRRYGDTLSAEVEERLAFELDTIIGMGFPGYFLIVQDFIQWAKDHGIPVGPGRGSAAGSIVAYALGITDMCPLRYGLLFERFLNPGRKSMPDIDIDFCKDGRERVIRYVADKYGHDAVTQIMTLGTMKARMAIKDVARAFEWTPEEAQELANLVPEDPSGKHDLAVCLGKKPLDKDKGVYGTVEAMVRRHENDPRTAEVLDASLRLEKLGRSLGVHACGIIIAPGPVSDYVPVCTVKDKPATQYNMTQVEKCGLLKMDFLGLKTMSILKKAADIVRDSEGLEIDYGTVPLDDPATFKLLATGETLGVFQCESSGFQELIRLMRPDRFEDMIALVALYRPGPLMANMHIDYCDRKAGRAKVEYPHPVLETVLKETYGLYIYQEQVMSISRELCGFTPAQADDLRKAMGKKDLKTLQKLEQDFVEGAWNRHQFDRGVCKAMWEKILGFASYCFNKSHSACYGLIAYWTAYMKANHFAAFMTANLVYEMDNKEKMTLFVEELRTRQIPVLPPDVNSSRWDFALAKDGERTAVRFGFGGVKGIGEQAAAHLIERRKEGPYQGLFEVCERTDSRVINKRVVEALIKVGAFDTVHANRAAVHAAMDRAFERAGRMGKGRDQGQESLFSVFEADESFRAATQGYPDLADWNAQQKLADEKALTGYWISSHPVAEAGAVLKALATIDARGLKTQPTSWRHTVAVVIVGKRSIKTKTGKMMAILHCEDPGGRFEAVLFPGGKRAGEAGAFEKFDALAQIDTVALITGTVERRSRGPRPPPPPEDGDEPLPVDEDGGGDAPAPAASAEESVSLVVTDLVPSALVYERLAEEVRVGVDLPAVESAPFLAGLDAIITDHRGGRCRVVLQVHDGDRACVSLALGESHRIHPTAQALERLRTWANGRLTIATDEG